MKRLNEKRIVGFIICALLIAALLGFVVMTLWNQVLVAVLHVSVITFWQALGILVLSKILFGGFRKGWGGHRRGHWKKEIELREKWHTMTPEEREKIKQEWRSRCRVWGKRDEDPATGAE